VAEGQPGAVLAGASRGSAAVFRSEDGGVHWAFSDEGILDATAVALATDRRKSSRIYAGGFGVFRSDDYGESWLILTRGFRPDRLFVDPSDSENLYAQSGGRLWRSPDGGVRWIVLTVPTPESQISSFALDTGGSVYTAGPAGVLKSTDHGNLWSPANIGLRETYARLFADPLQPDTLYAVQFILSPPADLVFKTTVGAASWKGPIFATDTFVGLAQIEPSSTSPGTLYAVVSRYTLQFSGGSVYVSTDGGGAWSFLFSAPCTSFVCRPTIYAIASDPVRASTLYASTDTGLYRLTSNGTSAIVDGSDFTGTVLVVSPDGSTLYGLRGLAGLDQTLFRLRLGHAAQTVPFRD
jgi:photosystem II stability/assembly factor-like uncharacterized protein